MERKVRLLIVDDSMVTRKMIQQMIGRESWIEVVGTAANGLEGVEKARALGPDVVTMDIRMPVMDGLQALKKIMHECPTRVVMLSAVTTEGADETLEALAAGAIDFIPKLEGGKATGPEALRRMLLAKLRIAVKAQLSTAGTGKSGGRPVAGLVAAPAPGGAVEVVLIGASTGGPNALQLVVSQLPAELPVGVLIVQHMPATFTRQLARRLDQDSRLRVKEAEDGDEVGPGKVLVAPGHSHMVVRRRGQVGLAEEPADLLHRPSVDVLMESAARVYGAGALAVVLTGMGRDGEQGVTALKAKGGRVIAQDEATCVVYGMPRAVADAGLADQVCPLAEIPAAIVSYLRNRE